MTLPTGPTPPLVAPLEDGSLAGLVEEFELRLEKPLREPDEERDQLRDADAAARGARRDPDVPGEVADPVAPLDGESHLVHLLGEGVDPRVEGAFELRPAAEDLLR